MIKLVVTDLDETLLRGDKTVSPRTRAAFLKLREQGVKTLFATARGESARRLVPDEMFDGRIQYNGSLAFAGEELVYSRLVDVEGARELLLRAEREGLYPTAEIGGRHYSNAPIDEVWDNIREARSCDFRTLGGKAEKLYCWVRREEELELLRGCLPENAYLVVSRDGMAQVMHREATKARAAQALAAYWGIGMEEAAAFGDDLNDMDLLRSCGRGIAMGNALEEVKAAADAVCGANEEDGLAKWLEEHVLNKSE